MNRWQKSARTWAALIIALVAAAALSAPAMATSKPGVIRIGVPPWPGVTIKSAVVAQILKPLGYEIKYIKASAPIIYNGLASGKVDLNMSAWSPGQAPTFMPYVKAGKILKLGENLSGATAGFAVPGYVYEAGLQTDPQIPKYAQKFDKTIYCIDPGSGANAVVKKGIDNDIYGLRGWHMVVSSTASMLAEVKRATSRKEWIMFCAWQPHWMNVAFDMRYLKDPKNLWGPGGGKSRVWTLVDADLPQTNPAATKFLKRFQVSAGTQSQWIYDFSYKEQPADSVADKWIASHLDQVAAWLDGLKTINGGNAVEAIKAHYGNSK